MAISPAFTVSQSALNPAQITVTDTSTGTDVTITQRRLYVQNAYGVYLTGDDSVDYDEWPIANVSISESLIPVDNNISANVKVEWCDVNGDVVTSLNANYPFPQYGKQFFFYLVQSQGLTPGIFQDSNYSGNLSNFWAYLNAGINAVEDGNDLSGAQNCFNLVNQMQQNQNDYF